MPKSFIGRGFAQNGRQRFTNLSPAGKKEKRKTRRSDKASRHICPFYSMKSRQSKISKQKVFILALISLGCVAFVALLIKLNDAYGELSLWESRRHVLEEELRVLKIETRKNRLFLEKLRNDPEFQNDVARRELGYAAENEKTFRFTEK